MDWPLFLAMVVVPEFRVPCGASPLPIAREVHLLAYYHVKAYEGMCGVINASTGTQQCSVTLTYDDI